MYAVINGEVVRKGDEIDGFTLTRIEPDAIELRRDKDRVVLTLPQPGEERKQSGKPLESDVYSFSCWVRLTSSCNQRRY